MTIRTEMDKRKITEILHFTTHRGVVGILSTGLLKSRYRLPQDEYLEHVLHYNAKTRPEASKYFDKSQNWLDYVNLSISEINKRYLNFSKNWHKDSDVWWAVLAFDVEVASHDGVFFTTTNNSYELCSRDSGLPGLSALFASQVGRKAGWTVKRNNRPDNMPTCEQAETLYPGEISTKLLRKIYVENDEFNDVVSGWLKEFEHERVEVITSAQKFLGKAN